MAVLLDISHPTFMVWGSNTGVGKTVVSTGLAFSVLSNSDCPSKFLYLKPVQTGFPLDSDARFLHRKVSDLIEKSPAPHFGLVVSNHVLKASVPAAQELLGVEKLETEQGLKEVDWSEETSVRGREKGQLESVLECKTLFSWNEAVSPHLAAERERAVAGDGEVVELLGRCLEFGVKERERWKREDVWKVVETAGGVASPGPSGTLQCDLYRPFRIPAILVGDGHLGGISGTISSYESLMLRGYDVVAVIIEDHGLSNDVPLLSYLRNRVRVFVMPPVPHHPANDLLEWFDKSSKVFNSLRDLMLTYHLERMQRLHDMAGKAATMFWWPFTQHNLIPVDSVTVIDSRCGENFAVHKVCGDQELIIPQFDACASWWTQGPNPTLQIELARDMGYACARFGHVMFPENVYEPALQCAELLLDGVGKRWASRCFFSDNGSTAIEIALKMAFRKYLYDHGVLSDKAPMILKVLALSGSYHGDTLGAMEAQAPSSYTGFLQQPWYSGRGIFLDPPTVFLRKKRWELLLPEVMTLGRSFEDSSFSCLDEVFYGRRDLSKIASIYSEYISNQMAQFSKVNGTPQIGALIMEPVIQGAGGMNMIDPFFQSILVKECRRHKIPVIFDEVFTGFWRLGKESAAELLGCLPDIACYAKLMTGGVIPLAATLTTEDVFNAFKGNSKVMALLHGHSYSAHALGCTAAAKAIRWFGDPKTNSNISTKGMIELWDKDLVLQISSHPAVQRVVALGTVCAVELKAEGSDAGYASQYASSLIKKLREDGLHMRPLGNVVYLMCSPCTSPRVCHQLLTKLYLGIEEFSRAQAAA